MNYSSKTTKTKTTKTTAKTVTQTETKERNWSFPIQPVLDWFKVILGVILGI